MWIRMQPEACGAEWASQKKNYRGLECWGLADLSHAMGKFDMCCVECCVELIVQGNPMRRMKGYGTNSQRATAGTPWGMCESK